MRQAAVPAAGATPDAAPVVPWDVWLLRVTACAVVALAPVEGYLPEQLASVPAVLLVLAWLMVRVRYRTAPLLHGAHVLLAGLSAVLLASTAAHLGEPYALEYAVRWVPFLVLAAVLIDVVGRDVPARLLLVAAVVGAVAAGLGALHGVLVLGEPRASGPLVAALSLLLVIVPTKGIRRRVRDRRTPGRVAPDRVRTARVALVLGAAAVLVAGAASTLSPGGALAVVAAVAVLVARRAVPVRVLGGIAAVVAAGAAALVLVAPAQVERVLDEKPYVAGTDIDPRELRWQAAARMFAENPVLGVGPGGFRSEYAAASNVAEVGDQTPAAHHTYLEVAAELGLPGLLLFLGFVAAGLVASERALRRGADRRTVVAVQAALVAVLVASASGSEQYRLPLWALVAVACGLELREARER